MRRQVTHLATDTLAAATANVTAVAARGTAAGFTGGKLPRDTGHTARRHFCTDTGLQEEWSENGNVKAWEGNGRKSA